MSSKNNYVVNLLLRFKNKSNKIEVIKKGSVKRAKLYYLRNRTGKRARIADSNRGDEADQYLMTEIQDTVNEENKKDDKVYENTETTIVEGITKNDENEMSEKLSKEPVKEPVAEEKKSVKGKSESTASVADKTEDESKS